MKTLKTLMIIMILLVYGNIHSATVSSVVPIVGTSSAPIMPIINLTTSKNVYLPELKHFSPMDTSEQSYNPQIYLIQTDYYNNLNDTLHAVVSEEIFIDTLNSTTLALHLYEPLEYETEYTLIIEGLPVKDNADPIVTYIDTTLSVYFTTIADSPKIIGYSPFLSNEVINCKDTIDFYFAGPIDTNIVSIDSLFHFSKITDYYADTVAVDSILMKTTRAEVTLNHFIDSTNRKVSFYPSSSYEQGTSYSVFYEASRFGIDTSYNFSSSFYVRPASYIRTISVSNDTTISIPDSLQPSIGNKYFNLESGDTIRVSVNDDNPYLRFSHWESEEFSYINNSTDRIISLYTDCEKYSYLSDIRAIYIEPCVDTIQITIDVQDSIESIDVYGYLDSLGGGRYTVSVIDTNKIRLVLNTKSNYVLDECQAHDSIEVLTIVDNIVDLDFNLFELPCDTLYEITFNTVAPLADCDELEVCVAFSDINDNISLDVNQIFDVEDITFGGNSNHQSGCVSFSTPPDQRTFTLDASIIGSYIGCYEIAEIVADGEIIMSVYKRGDDPITEIIKDFELDADAKCELDIKIFLRPKRFTLEVHHVLANDEFLPEDVYLNVINNKLDPNGNLIGFDKIYDPIETDKVIDYIEYYEYPCGLEAKYHPIVVNSRMFSFGKWLTPFDFSPTDYSVIHQVVDDTYYTDEITFTMDDNYKIYYEYNRSDFYALELHVVEEDDVTYKKYKFDGVASDLDAIPRQPFLIGMDVDIKNISNQDSYPTTQTLPKPSTDVDLYQMNRNYHKKTSKVGVLFSDAVDKNSLVTSYLDGYEGMYGADIGDPNPIDNRSVRPDLYTASTYDGAIDGTRGGSIDVVTSDYIEFTFATEIYFIFGIKLYIYAPHDNKLKFILGKDIARLSDGEKLANPTEDRRIQLKTRNPGLYVYFESYSRLEFDWKNILDGDNCSGSDKPDIYYHLYSTVAKSIATTNELDEIQIHKSGKKSDNIEDDVANTNIIDVEDQVLRVTRLEDNYYPMVGLSFADEGNAEAYSKITETISKVAGAIADAYVGGAFGEVSGSDGNPFKPGKLVELAMKLFFETGIFQCDDVPMGHLDWVGNPINRWSPDKTMGYLYMAGKATTNDPIYTDYPYPALKIWRHSRIGGRMYWILGDF